MWRIALSKLSKAECCSRKRNKEREKRGKNVVRKDFTDISVTLFLTILIILKISKLLFLGQKRFCTVVFI